MPVLDKDGFVLGDDGSRVKDADGAEIQVEGTANQEAVDKVVVALKAEIKTLRKSKADLEAKGEKVVELEELIAQKDEQVRDAEGAAAAKAGAEMDGLKSKVQQLENDATKKTIKNAILEHAGGFVEARYLANELRGAGVIGEDGSVKFKVMVEEEGKEVEKVFSAKEAAEHVAEKNPALVKSVKDGGSGTQNTGFGDGVTPKRSDMSRKEKVVFIGNHPGKFRDLPNK